MEHEMRNLVSNCKSLPIAVMERIHANNPRARAHFKIAGEIICHWLLNHLQAQEFRYCHDVYGHAQKTRIG